MRRECKKNVRMLSSDVKVIVLIFLLLIGENFCFKETYKPRLSNAIEAYEDLVKLRLSTVGPLSESEEIIVNKTLDTLELCLEEEDEDDEEFLNICLCNLEDCMELYCNLNNYLDYKECSQPHNSSLENLSFKILYTYDNLKQYQEGTLSLKKLNALDNSNSEILILLESEDGGYELKQVNLQCLQRIFENRKTKPLRWLENTTVAYVVNLISFFSLIVILLLYTLVKELGVPISVKSWQMVRV